MKFNILGTFLFLTVIISKFKKGMADPSTNTTVTCGIGEMSESDIENIRSKCTKIGGTIIYAYRNKSETKPCYSNVESINCIFCNQDQEDVFYSSIRNRCLPRELKTGEGYCLPGDLFNEKVEEFEYKCKYYGGDIIGNYNFHSMTCYEKAKFSCRLVDYYGPHSIKEVRSSTTKPSKAITKSVKTIPTRTTSQSYFPTNLPKEERVKSFIDYCKNSNGYFDESSETCVLCSYGYVPDHINGSCKQEIPEFECQTPADLEVAKQKCEAIGGFIREFETVNNCSISTCYFCPIGYIQSNGKCAYKYGPNPTTIYPTKRIITQATKAAKTLTTKVVITTSIPSTTHTLLPTKKVTTTTLLLPTNLSSQGASNKSATAGLKTITTQATKAAKTLTTKVVITTSIPSTTHTLLPTKKVTTTTLLLPTNLSGQGAPLSTCYPKTITVTEKKTVTFTEKETVTVTINADSTSSGEDKNQNCSPKWGQCGGLNYNGPTCCQSGSTCREYNPYFSQCI